MARPDPARAPGCGLPISAIVWLTYAAAAVLIVIAATR